MLYDKKMLENGVIHASNPGIDRNVHTRSAFLGEDLCRVNRRFMGAGMSQSYVGIYFFEYYQESNQFEYIVEFGSQKGALSTYFANMAAITERFYFDTFEWNKSQDWNNRINEGAGHWFEKLASISPYINTYEQDIFSEKTYNHVKENMNQFKTFIFCDGGDKVKEFNMYAPLLKAGDRIAVHDWDQEIRMSQIQETCNKHNLIVDDHWADSHNVFGTLIMPFRKGE